MPTVSVIVPNYNYKNYLPLRMESIFNQTFQDFEVIILDDNSRDSSKCVIENFRNQPKVAHIVYNNVNSGSPFIQWDKGILLAKGEWIWIAEADDLADKYLLETLVANTFKSNSIVISYCQSYRMDAEGNLIGNWKDWTSVFETDLFETDFVMKGYEYIDSYLYKKNTIPNASAVIFNKSAYLKIGKVDTDIRFCSDWLTWLKILTVGDIAYCSNLLNYFRQHDESVIASSNKDKILFLKKYDIILRKRFLKFIRNRNDLNIPLIQKTKITESFRSEIAVEYEMDARFFEGKGLKAKSGINLLFSLPYTNNKKHILYIFLIRYIFPKWLISFIKKLIIK